MRPVVAIDAHVEGCTYVIRHRNKAFAGPTRIPNTRAALTKLCKQYPDHDFVLEVCAVHEWMMDLVREHDVNARGVIPPKNGPIGKKSDDDDATLHRVMWRREATAFNGRVPMRVARGVLVCLGSR